MKEKIVDLTQQFGPVVARILIGGMFLMAGIGKVATFASTVGYIESVGLPAASLLAVLAILVEIVGGLFIITGYQAFLGGAVLIGFTLIVTATFHLPNVGDQIEMILLTKNLAIVGGLLYIMTYGSGPYSFKHKEKDSENPVVVDMEKSGDFGA